MLNRSFLSEDKALWHFDMALWLLNHYGVPHTPDVPSPLHYKQPISEWCWGDDDQRMPLIWAEDHYARLSQETKLPLNEMTLLPVEDKHRQDVTAPDTALFTAGWQNDPDLRITLGVHGHPVIGYDPKRCSTPGYFSMKIIMACAKYLVGSRQKPDDLLIEDERSLTHAAAAFVGQGFTLLSVMPALQEEFLMGDERRRHLRKDILNNIAFATVLNLAARSMMPEQIIATYGTHMSKPLRKSIWTIYRQIEKFPSELKMLRLMVSKQRRSDHDQIFMALKTA